MLQGDLYSIVSRFDREIVVELNRECEIYAAHFPSHPITPGVTIVQIAVELLSLVMDWPVDVTYAKNIKFLVPIIPAQNTRLTFRFVEDGEIEVYFEEMLCASMNIKIK